MFVVPLIAQKILSRPPAAIQISDVGVEVVFEQKDNIQISDISVEIVLEEV